MFVLFALLFVGYVYFKQWWSMTFGEFESFMQLLWGLLW